MLIFATRMGNMSMFSKLCFFELIIKLYLNKDIYYYELLHICTNIRSHQIRIFPLYLFAQNR